MDRWGPTSRSSAGRPTSGSSVRGEMRQEAPLNPTKVRDDLARNSSAVGNDPASGAPKQAYKCLYVPLLRPGEKPWRRMRLFPRRGLPFFISTIRVRLGNFGPLYQSELS